MHEKAKHDIKHCLNECSKLLRTSLLPPATIHEAVCLERDLKLELKQLELYEEELEKLKKRSPEAHCLAYLAIAKQPFPKPIKKGTTVSGADGEHEEPTLVRLLTASKVCYSAESKVIGEVVSEDSKKGEEVFVAGEKELDEEGYATFYDLKFAKPTRLNVAHLYFHVQIRFLTGDDHYGGASMTLRSPPSSPFVVITNESQWGDSEGMLMRLKAFYQETISWQYMANLIQTHFLRSTRQDVTKPERPLSLSDLNFLAKWRFENKTTITKEAYEDFWGWFGLACRRIRHQLPFHSLWMKGLILGLISRQDAERLLAGEAVGTFVIRFSETNPGKIVLSYVKNEESMGGKVAHLLLAYGPREAPKHLQNILEKKIVFFFFFDIPFFSSLSFSKLTFLSQKNNRNAQPSSKSPLSLNPIQGPPCSPASQRKPFLKTSKRLGLPLFLLIMKLMTLLLLEERGEGREGEWWEDPHVCRKEETGGVWLFFCLCIICEYVLCFVKLWFFFLL